MPTHNTKEYNKTYYEEHKDKFKPKEYYCDVCKVTVKSNKSRHLKTKVHLRLSNSF